MKQQNTRPDNYNSLFAVNFRNLIDKAKDGYQKLGRKKNIRKELADHCGVSEQSISNWYNGKNEPDPMQRKAIAEYFGIAEDFLFRDHSPRQNIQFSDEEQADFDDDQIWDGIMKSTAGVSVDNVVAAVVLREVFYEFVSETLKCITRAAHVLKDKNTRFEFEDLAITKEFAAKMLIHDYCEHIEAALTDAAFKHASAKALVEFVANNRIAFEIFSAAVNARVKGEKVGISKLIEKKVAEMDNLSEEERLVQISKLRISIEQFAPILLDYSRVLKHSILKHSKIKENE